MTAGRNSALFFSCFPGDLLIEALVQTLPMSLGVAISPLPILSLIVLLMTAKAKVAGPALLVGWVLGILMVGSLVFLLPGLEAADGGPTRFAGVLRIGMGVALLLLAWWQWRTRPEKGEPAALPRLVTRVDSFRAPHALLTGIALTGLNPKNLPLVVDGATTISYVAVDPIAEFGALAGFAGIASIPLVLLITGYFLARQKSETLLSSCKDWLTANNVPVTVTILLAIGTFLILRGTAT